MLEANVIESESDSMVPLVPANIFIAHRLGNPKSRNASVIVMLCKKKKINQMVRKRAEPNNQQRKVYINDYLTRIRVTMLKVSRISQMQKCYHEK